MRALATGVGALLLWSSAMVSVGVFWGRGHPKREDRVAALQSPAGGSRALSVRVSEDFAQRFGLVLGRVASRRLSPALDVVGSVDFDADFVADVGARIAGRVTRVLAHTGDVVVRGEPLVELESAAVGDAYAAHVTAVANANEARARLSRESALLAQRLTTAREVEQARADLSRYEAEVRGAAQRLSSMGAGQGASRAIVLRAPLSGQVITRDVVVGQTIAPTDIVMRVADLSEVWVLLDVFERDLSRVHPGDPAEIESETWPDRVFRGSVSYVGATIDTHTRTARVRIEVANDERRLRPGQFVSARVRSASLGAREVSTVPTGAVVQIEGRPAVFVRRSPRDFEAQWVSLGAFEGREVEVHRGVSAGDEIVVEGAFALKSEMLR